MPGPVWVWAISWSADFPAFLDFESDGFSVFWTDVDGGQIDFLGSIESLTPVPEPHSGVLLLLGLAAMNRARPSRAARSDPG
ncbi:MAG: PEP-CTERM sorting domain-containing protein [Myxococcota bacterium]